MLDWSRSHDPAPAARSSRGTPAEPVRARARLLHRPVARPDRGRGLRRPAARRPAVRGRLRPAPGADRAGGHRAVAVPGVARLARAALARRPPALAHPHQADRLVPVHRPGAGRAADVVHGRGRRAAARPHGLARRDCRGRAGRRRAADDGPHRALRAARGRRRGGTGAARTARGCPGAAPRPWLHPAARGTRRRELRHGSAFAAGLAGGPRPSRVWWRASPTSNLPAEVLRAVWKEKGAALLVELPVDAAFLAEIERRTTIHVLGASEMQVEVRDDKPAPERGVRDGAPVPAGGSRSRPAAAS